MCCLPQSFRPIFLKILLAAAIAGALFYSRGDSGSRSFPVEKDRTYGVLISAPQLSVFNSKDSKAEITVVDPSGATLTKSLHAGDADWYLTVHPAKSGSVTISGAVNLNTSIHEIPASPDLQIASTFNRSWQSAEPIQLGRTVYAAADDRPYIPRLSSPAETFDQMTAGIHWYKLDYTGHGDRLVHFNVDILDRDVPAGLAIFTIENNQPIEYTRGRERYETEKSTNFHGLAKFAPRILSPGSYYIRVMANHPFYKLETDHYPPPPYTDPRQAVRTAMDYIVRKGDSWHANVPREGAVSLRNSTNLQETRLCIACHPTHFSTRGALFAIENGYKLRARSSLQFLIERLYNNPRPIYGKTDASWARMIHAPGNVLSRIAYLTSKHEGLVSGERREELYRGIASYLEMYWPNMTEPGHESNGNLPRISGYEVALHNAMLFDDLYMRTGEAKYKSIRDQIENIVVNGKIDDTLDLCWKIDALVWLGREKYAQEIDALRDQLFALQQKDGRWAMPFGLEEVQYDFARQRKTIKKIPARPGQEGPRASEFQTWHAIYALARAGVKIDDPRLRKAVDLCLSRQTPSGAWQGNPDYKNFDTPFRDTQYALMALSTLFPEQRKTSSEVAPLARIDSPHVLVRYQAVVARGESASADSIPKLAILLGDPSKLVQRAAAWSLRQIASRNPQAKSQAVQAIAAALDSPDGRTRWGATRIFNQHFKYLSEEWILGERLRRLASSDPVPSVKMAAIQALYLWWYWDRDPAHKAAIEETLIAGFGRQEHPWVRRNFIEAYYSTLDDNVRYLYGSWLPRVKHPEDKKVIEDGHKAMVLSQALRYRDAMINGNSLTRDGLLRALYTHHIREGLPDISAMANVTIPPTVQGHWVNGYKFSAMYDPLTAGTGTISRIGNDSEAPVFYADSAPVMNEAFLAALNDESPQVIASAMRALIFLRNLKIEQPLAHRILALLESPARADVATVIKTQLRNMKFDHSLVDRLARTGDAQTLEVLGALRQQASPEVLSERLLNASPEDRIFPQLVAMSTALLDNPQVVNKILSGLASKRPQPQQAVLRLALTHPGKIRTLNGYPENYGPFAIGGSLLVIASLDHTTSPLPEIRRILVLGLASDVHTIRSQALTTLRSVEPLHKDPEILQRVTALKRDPDKNVRASALAFESSQLARAGSQGVKPEEILDYFFFKEQVEPIFFAKGADGESCAHCHASHAILKLNEPDEYGVITLSQSRANYSATARMVNVRDPESSLLLFKPTVPIDDAGIGDSIAFTHNGGIRWPAKKNSREYRTILRWIQGARLDAASE